jgi:thiamine-phosphate pyrophosphorylase
MTRRQSDMPVEWLIVGPRSANDWAAVVRRLPRGTGVLVLDDGPRNRRRQEMFLKLRRICKVKRLTPLDEAARRVAVRVHDARELRRALSARIPLILLSPIFLTNSHPDWKPLPRMKAATLARLANRRAVALGGMTRRRFRAIQKLGFVGWAGIDAWIRT